MSAMNTPPVRLLKVVKRISAKSPCVALTAPTPAFNSDSPVCPASRRIRGSGILMVSRWTSTTTIATSAMMMVPPMPSVPMARPLKTLVTRNAMPCTEPTSPLAFARFSAGTSKVTVVESAMLRSCSTTAPISITTAKIQNQTPEISSKSASGISRNIVPASPKNSRVNSVEPSMTACLRYLSTITPKNRPKTETSSM